MLKHKKQLISLIFAVFLSSCTFHLRGVADVPTWLNNVAIITHDGNKVLSSLLRLQLEGYHLQVNKDETQAKYWLVIHYVHIKQQIISIGASTNPRQYQLIMAVRFSVQTRQGTVIKPAQKAIVTRQLTINNDRILGSTQEEALFISEMYQDIAIQIINRLAHHE